MQVAKWTCVSLGIESKYSPQTLVSKGVEARLPWTQEKRPGEEREIEQTPYSKDTILHVCTYD